MPFIDYAEVRRLISLEDVLRLIQYRFLVKTSWRCYGRCPLNCCANSRGATFYLPRNLWFCHRCKRGGNQLDLYVLVKGGDIYHAAIELCNRMAIVPPEARQQAPLTEKDIREYRKGKKS